MPKTNKDNIKIKKEKKSLKTTKEVKTTKEKIIQEKVQEKKHDGKNYFIGLGRRKRAIARIRLYNEKGVITVNNIPIEQYYPGEIFKTAYSEPLRTTNTLDKISLSILVNGGGRKAQLDAIILGISRALIKLNPEFKTNLRKKGFLTRDPRVKERKKPGLMGARKQKQSPKR